MKKFLSIVLALVAAITASAAIRTPEAAAQLAADFTNNQPALSRMHRSARTSSNLSLAHTFNKPASPEAAVYAFNQENGNGFVLVSADDRTMDILCYADKGTFDLQTANPNFLWWVNRYVDEVANVDDTNAYTGGSMVRRAAQTTAISPLLGNTAWDQETPYWNKCPMDLWKTTERCLTGCVATATAQIMRYWQYPAQGTGSHSYTWYCCTDADCNTTKSKTLAQDFSTITFDWANMLDTYGTSTSSYTTAQANAVSTLMYALGVACDMQYGGSTIGGSGAWTDDMGQALIDYFGYKNTVKFVTTYSKSGYEGNNGKGTACPMANAQWNCTASSMTTMFNTELEAGRPILMGGESNEGGHEFVCDGRDTQGKFHINWGWSGDCNCYCALTSLKPSGANYSFSSQIDALIGLEPASLDTIDVTGVTVSPTTASININGKQQLTATVSPADATNKAVTWSSSNSNVATVSNTGLVKGVSAGTATITATTVDGNFMASATVTVSSSVEPSYSFSLVTSVNDLMAGDEVLLVNRENSKAMSTTQNTGNRGVAAVTIANDAIELEEGQTAVQVFTLKAGKAANQWAFYTGSGYIYAASSSQNQLKTASALTNDGSFSISIASGDATIVANGSNTRNTIRYNSTNDIFSCYGSTSSVSGTVSIFARSTSQPTSLQDTKTTTTVEKFIRDGQLFIRRGDKVYNAAGVMVY